MQIKSLMLLRLPHLLCDKFAQAAVHIELGLLKQLWLWLLLRGIQSAEITETHSRPGSRECSAMM